MEIINGRIYTMDPAFHDAIGAGITLFQAVQYKKDMEKWKLDKKDFEMEPWIPVLNREIPLKAHAHRADDILTAIRIAKEFDIDITIDHGTEGHLIDNENVRFIGDCTLAHYTDFVLFKRLFFVLSLVAIMISTLIGVAPIKPTHLNMILQGRQNLQGEQE